LVWRPQATHAEHVSHRTKEESCRLESGFQGTSKAKEEQMSEERKYPIGGYAPGNYLCNCVNCKNEFQGDKRAVQCEPCAVAAEEAWKKLNREEQLAGLRKAAEQMEQIWEQIKFKEVKP
jgi:hypothetical protein